jgi:hypothetical protein
VFHGKWVDDEIDGEGVLRTSEGEFDVWFVNGRMVKKRRSPVKLVVR